MRPLAAFVFMATVATFGATDAPGPRLSYGVQRLGNAVAVSVAQPGAAGSACAFELTYSLGSWSRFNWPQFAPKANLRQVGFCLRGVGPEPATVQCRILADDGIEWQSAAMAVTAEWQSFTLKAGDFSWFRGDTRETAGALDLGRAVQFQLVPADRGGKGSGSLFVDEIRFHPDGPAWTAESGEQRLPRAAVELEHERLRDLLGRWLAEIERLTAEMERTRRWVAAIEGMAAAWKDQAQRQVVLQQLGARRYPWQEAAPICRGPARDAALSLEDYRRQLQSLDAAPVPLLDLGLAPKLSVDRLYGAPVQEEPSVVTLDGSAVLRHRIRFSAEAVRQTVFTDLALPRPTDVSGHRILARLRCSATGLHETTPILLRLFTDGGGNESWADYTPTPGPGPEWQDVAFDVGNPVRQTRGNPAATLSLGLRFENRPGTAADFVVEVADLRLAPPEPAAALRRTLLQAAGDRVTAARNRLAEWRDRVAAAEDALRDDPELRRLYLSSFEQRLPVAVAGAPASAPVIADSLAGLPLPPRPLNPARLSTRTVSGAGGLGVAIRVAGLDPAADLRATLLSSAGDILASARGQGESLVLPAARAAVWRPGQPWRYRLRVAVLEAGRLAVYDERDIGVRTAAVIPAGPTPLLRHVTQRRQPDWSFQLNGECWFPRMTVYHWPEPGNSEVAGARLFADLWLDGTRAYGFRVEAAAWERSERLGLATLTGLAPSYRPLESWDDLATWEAEYAAACRRAVPFSDRPAQIVAQVGNEVELAAWGADLGTAFPDALYQPLDVAAAVLRREWDPAVPIMYVRAGTFREVPPLPHEQLCGVNQYTGRYSGRLDEVDRDLAELARYSLWADRPLMITEWMGPQYSWASSGVGGVSPRGAAYYLERYWRAMINTPGIVGSSEFTLNWVIAPFEDLTNQTRAEAWKDRPPHDAFGGGHTADHIPVVGPDQARRDGPCFRSLQAFQSPLYVMAGSPGAILVCGEGAERLAEALRPSVPAVRATAALADADLAGAEAHLVILHPVSAVEGFPAGASEPAIHTCLNPRYPDRLITTLAAGTPAARERGLDRLVAAAAALGELREAEGAMTRALVLTDPATVSVYTRYVLELAGRGYLFSGDDVRTELRAEEILDTAGQRRPAWADLSAVILDCARPLQATELDLSVRLGREGANLIVSAGCYAANPRLQDLLPAKLLPAGTLADHVAPADRVRTPLAVHDLGGADLERIRRFRPDLADSPALALFRIDCPGSEPLALDAAGQPVIVRQALGSGSIFLVGAQPGAAAEVHWRVTHAGLTHPLYDRDTACGLERLSRVVVNLCRFGTPEKRPKPRLFVRLTPDRTRVVAGEPLQGTLELCDVQGKTVGGQVRARVRVSSAGRAGALGAYTDLPPAAPGRFELRCALDAGTPASGDGPVPGSGLTYRLPDRPAAPLIASVQIKAYAPGFVPADGALAFVVENR
jgi:hypothetical protein